MVDPASLSVVRYTAHRAVRGDDQLHLGRSLAHLAPAEDAAASAVVRALRRRGRWRRRPTAHRLGLAAHAAVIHSFDPPERFVAGHRRRARPAHLLPAGPRAAPGSPASRWRSSRCSPRRAGRRAARRADPATAPPTTIPAITPVGLIDTDPLEQPIEEEFRAGTITLSWDADDERVVIEVFPYAEGPSSSPGRPERGADEEPEPEEIFLVRMPAGDGPRLRRAGRVGGRGRPRALPVLRRPDGPRAATCARAPTASADATREPEREQRSTARRTCSTSASWCIGRIMPASNAHLPGGGSTSDGAQVRLQADLGRAAAVGLPGRHARRPRGTPPTWSPRRLGWDVVPPTGCATGPAGPGMVQLWREPDAEVRTRSTSSPEGPVPEGYLHVLDAVDGRRPAGRAGPRGHRRRCGGWRSSTSSSTTPTARAATCWRWPTGTATASTTGSASTSTTSCARCCGGGPASRSTTRSRGVAALERALDAAAALREDARATLLDRARGRRTPHALPAAAARRDDAPCRVGGWPSIPWPPF